MAQIPLYDTNLREIIFDGQTGRWRWPKQSDLNKNMGPHENVFMARGDGANTQIDVRSGFVIPLDSHGNRAGTAKYRELGDRLRILHGNMISAETGSEFKDIDEASKILVKEGTIAATNQDGQNWITYYETAKRAPESAASPPKKVESLDYVISPEDQAKLDEAASLRSRTRTPQPFDPNVSQIGSGSGKIKADYSYTSQDVSGGFQTVSTIPKIKMPPLSSGSGASGLQALMNEEQNRINSLLQPITPIASETDYLAASRLEQQRREAEMRREEKEAELKNLRDTSLRKLRQKQRENPSESPIPPGLFEPQYNLIRNIPPKGAPKKPMKKPFSLFTEAEKNPSIKPLTYNTQVSMSPAIKQEDEEKAILLDEEFRTPDSAQIAQKLAFKSVSGTYSPEQYQPLAQDRGIGLNFNTPAQSPVVHQNLHPPIKSEVKPPMLSSKLGQNVPAQSAPFGFQNAPIGLHGPAIPQDAAALSGGQRPDKPLSMQEQMNQRIAEMESKAAATTMEHKYPDVTDLDVTLPSIGATTVSPAKSDIPISDSLLLQFWNKAKSALAGGKKAPLPGPITSGMDIAEETDDIDAPPPMPPMPPLHPDVPDGGGGDGGDGGGGDGGGGGGGPPAGPPGPAAPPSAAPAAVVAGAAPAPVPIVAEAPNVLLLPSLKRQQFMAPPTSDFSLPSRQVTEEEEKAYAEHIQKVTENEGKEYEAAVFLLKEELRKLRELNNVYWQPPALRILWKVLTPRQAIEFVASDKIYNETYNRLGRFLINVEKLPEDINDFQPKNNAMDRINQLAKIISAMNAQGKLNELAYVFAPAEERRLLESPAIGFTPEEVENILLRDNLAHRGPDVMAKKLLSNPKLNSHLNPNDVQMLKQIISNSELDQASREAGHLNDQEYIGRTQVYWTNLWKIASESLGTMELQEEFEKDQDDAQEKALTNWHILNKRMGDIERVISANPNNPVSQILGTKLSKVVNGLKDNTYDIREAYGVMNGVWNILQPVIEGKETLEDAELQVGELQPIQVEMRSPAVARDKTTSVEMRNAAYKDKMRQLRENNIFVFPNVHIKQGPKNRYGIPVGLTGVLLGTDAKNQLRTNLDNIMYTNVIKLEGDQGKIVATPPPVGPEEKKEEEKAEPNILQMHQLMGMARTHPEDLIKTWDEKSLAAIMEKVIKTIKKQKMLTFDAKRYNVDPAFDPKSNLQEKTLPDGKKVSPAEQRAYALQQIAEQIFDMDALITKTLNIDLPDVTDIETLKGLVHQNLTGMASTFEPQVKEVKYNILPVQGVIPRSKIRPVAKPIAIDIEQHPLERSRRAEMRQKKFSQENFKFGKTITKETPELNKAMYGENVIEYDVKTEADLMRMKSEVTRMKGKLYVIDLQSGRLFPITFDKAFVGQTYVFVKEEHKGPVKGGGFAYYPALHSAMRDAEKTLPYEFMRNGNDKAPQMMHMLHRVPYFNDYRDQMRKEKGAGFWKFARKQLNNLSQEIPKYVINKTSQAGQQYVKNVIGEGKDFWNKQRANINYIGNANKQFYANPSLSNFNRAMNRTIIGGARFASRPVISAAKQGANFTTLTENVPGINVGMKALEYTNPAYNVATHLMKGVKDADEGRFYDAAINAGDALLGSGKLQGSVDLGAKVLQAGLKTGEFLGADKNEHKK